MRNLFAAFTLMAIAGAASAQNVFYNQTPNVFGGYNTPLPSGGFATSQPNIFGGTTTTMPSGRSITGMPNLFGGQNFNDGTSTQRNVFGGTTYSRPGAPSVVGTPTFWVDRTSATASPRSVIFLAVGLGSANDVGSVIKRGC